MQETRNVWSDNWWKILLLYFALLSVPAVLECGYCLVGGVKFLELLCQNEGYSSGIFCIMSKKQWPAPSLRVSRKALFDHTLVSTSRILLISIKSNKKISQIKLKVCSITAVGSLYIVTSLALIHKLFTSGCSEGQLCGGASFCCVSLCVWAEAGPSLHIGGQWMLKQHDSDELSLWKKSLCITKCDIKQNKTKNKMLM